VEDGDRWKITGTMRKGEGMKRTALVVVAIFVCILNSSCNREVKGKIGDAEVTVVSLKRMTEFKFPGSGSGYGQPRPIKAEPGKQLVVIELKSDKEVKVAKAEVKNDKGQMYEVFFQQMLNYQDKPGEMSLVFVVPEQTALKTLMINETSFDLSKVSS